MRITFLGSGTSMGVPTIGCECSVCLSLDSRNKRTRPSLLINVRDRNFLIDTSTDFRQQAIREGLRRVDAVLYTHEHADHVLGLDDLRPFNYWQKAHIPCFGSASTLESICRMFRYVFSEPQPGGSMPRIEPRVVEGDFEYLDVLVQPLPVLHGKLPVLGYKIGRISYITDCSEIPDETLERLQGTKILVLGVLRYEAHPTHLNVEKALKIINRVAPERTYFTHLSHVFDHEPANRDLPDSVELSYDGLTFEMDEP